MNVKTATEALRRHTLLVEALGDISEAADQITNLDLDSAPELITLFLMHPESLVALIKPMQDHELLTAWPHLPTLLQELNATADSAKIMAFAQVLDTALVERPTTLVAWLGIILAVPHVVPAPEKKVASFFLDSPLLSCRTINTLRRYGLTSAVRISSVGTQGMNAIHGISAYTVTLVANELSKEYPAPPKSGEYTDAFTKLVKKYRRFHISHEAREAFWTELGL